MLTMERASFGNEAEPRPGAAGGHGSEARRLEALRRYAILDTPPEASFDRVVDIVADVLGVQVAMVTFVDRERSWYKAERGMGLSEMPREDNMCDAVIAQDGVLVIPDALNAPPALVRPLLKKGLRFYAGAPLRTAEGVNIGTLCAVDSRPRELAPMERRLLANLAEVVVDALELRVAARAVAQADEELRRLNADLARANANKSEFLAHMSHELRTPLNGIFGASELLAAGLFGPLNPRQAEYIRDIRVSANHLLKLIEDILDLSRIEAGHFELKEEHVEVSSLLERCAGMVRGVAETRGITLRLGLPAEPLVLECDERRLTEVVCNLLSNALKFSPEGGQVELRVSREGERAVFVVSDQGPGIPSELQERIFEEFYRVPDDREGTGLGLALARRLVELHGGSMWVQSTPGEGSRFGFSVPCRVASQA
jgi:signal transduction histidine kinase